MLSLLFSPNVAHLPGPATSQANCPAPNGPQCHQALMAVVGPVRTLRPLERETLGILCCPRAPGGPVLRVLVAQGYCTSLPVAVVALQGCQRPPLLKALGPPGRLHVREAVANRQLCLLGCSIKWTVGDGLKMARNFAEGCRKPFPLLRAYPHSVIPAAPPPWERKARLLRAQELITAH